MLLLRHRVAFGMLLKAQGVIPGSVQSPAAMRSGHACQNRPVALQPLAPQSASSKDRHQPRSLLLAQGRSR